MRVVLTGASGFVGSWLVPDLQSRGITVFRLLRAKEPVTSPDSGHWDPPSGQLDPELLEGADVLINLAGRNIAAGRWTAAVKRELWSSRVESTRTLVHALGLCKNPPALLINASATGYYGDRGEQELTEESPPGTDFVASLARAWEQEALAAQQLEIRVVLLRFGMVVGRGGAVARMAPAFRLGLGGPVGRGRQFWPWVAMEDVLGVVRHVMEHEEIAGAVNVVSPESVRCREFVRALGTVLRRPSFLPVPALAARLILGEMAQSLLLAGARVRPAALLASDYDFRVADLANAIRRCFD